MKLFIRHPRTGKPDMMTTLCTVGVVVASFKFLFDNSSYVQVFGHVDPMAYASFLGPILGIHGWTDNKAREFESKKGYDNPDDER